MPDVVMVVEDDHSVRALVRMLLEDEGLTVLEAATGTQAVERFAHEQVDLVLLDIRLPGMSGFEVCRQLRRTSDVPIVMVTAQHDSHDVVAGLEMGADDYITKPFNDRELLARVRAQLRRKTSAARADAAITVGDVVVKPDEGRASKAGSPLSLTKTEFRLLSHMAQNPNRVWSRDQLLEQVWGYAYQGDGRLVDTHIARLRAKIEDDPANPEYIETVRGLGYRLSTGGR
ncbi:MAG: response regulator transcription factor [Ilumatobacteraceae bacterium]